MKKPIITGLLFGLITSSLYAKVTMPNTNTNYNDAENLLKCMIQKIDNKEKKYIKKYAFLNLAYPDKDVSGLLNVDKQKVKDIATKAGEAIVDLMEDKCKNETKELFMKNSLQNTYLKLALIINKVITYSFLDKKEKDFKKQKELEQWFQKSLSEKKFSDFIHKLYLEKKQTQSNKK